MYNPFQIFNSPAFGQVRATLENGNLFVVGTDAARALGYARFVDAKDKSYMLVPILRRTSKSVEGQGRANVVPRRQYARSSHLQTPGCRRNSAVLAQERCLFHARFTCR